MIRALAIATVLLAATAADARYVLRPAWAWVWRPDPAPRPRYLSRNEVAAEICRLDWLRAHPSPSGHAWFADDYEARLRCALRHDGRVAR